MPATGKEPPQRLGQSSGSNKVSSGSLLASHGLMDTSRWLYTLFLMMDANFRARCKDRGFDDISLASGWAYYVEESRYHEHLKARSGDKQDVCYSLSVMELPD